MTHDTARPEPGPPSVADADVSEFLEVRPQLFGIAYRMLGSVEEAEDRHDWKVANDPDPDGTPRA